MDEGIQAINPYHWWIFAVLLIILEVLAPAFFFLWIGVSAGIVGVLLFLFPELGWKSQFLILSILSTLSIYLSRAYFKNNPTSTDHPTLNQRGSQYVNRIYTLADPIINGAGRLRVDDSSWKIQGPDLPAGHRVRVVEVDSITLVVEAVEAHPSATPVSPHDTGKRE